MIQEIYSAGRFSLTLTDMADEATINLLKETKYGHPGKTHYTQQQVPERIAHIPDLHFLQLKSSGKLIGSVGICPHLCNIGGYRKPAAYIRYFSVQNLFARDLTNHSKKETHSENVFSKALASFFNYNNTFAKLLGEPKETIYYYAFVESQNLRSLQMCNRFGFEATGMYDSILFSRFFPKHKPQVKKLASPDQQPMKELLCNYFKSYNFFRLEDDWLDDYFIWIENGEPILGAKARPVTWKIISLAGKSGKLMKVILPRIPILNKVFNPESHKFIALDYVYCKPGHESLFPEFFESILAHTQHYSALLFVDRLSDLHPYFIHSSQMGLMNRINKPVGVNILVKVSPIENAILSHLKNNPTYISTFGTT